MVPLNRGGEKLNTIAISISCFSANESLHLFGIIAGLIVFHEEGKSKLD